MISFRAIVCDVWYLPPMKRREDEDAVDFANRVKAEIARQGGLVDLMWYGYMFLMSVYHSVLSVCLPVCLSVCL